MSGGPPISPIHTSIWLEEPEPHDPLATRAAHCHGYDVYADVLGQARWADMIYLLLRGEAPSPRQAALLDALAVALCNPGPRDPAVHAAMCGGVGGSTAAACLIAALGVGAGQCGGARDVALCMGSWLAQRQALFEPDGCLGAGQVAAGAWLAWRDGLLAESLLHTQQDVWPALEHPPGFEPHARQAATVVVQALAALAALSEGPFLPWLNLHRLAAEASVGCPLAMTGVAAAALLDLGMSPQQGEMLHLMLRLPGAAAHALEQGEGGFKQFPFPPVDLRDDPRSPQVAGGAP
jgi:citrate synthase